MAVALGVFNYQMQRATIYAAARVDVIHGHLLSMYNYLTVTLSYAGNRIHCTDYEWRHWSWGSNDLHFYLFNDLYRYLF